MVFPVSRSHIRAVLSQDPVASREPSGEKETELTTPGCPVRVMMVFPDLKSHIRAVLYLDPVAIREPSGEKETE